MWARHPPHHRPGGLLAPQDSDSSGAAAFQWDGDGAEGPNALSVLVRRKSSSHCPPASPAGMVPHHGPQAWHLTMVPRHGTPPRSPGMVPHHGPQVWHPTIVPRHGTPPWSPGVVPQHGPQARALVTDPGHGPPGTVPRCPGLCCCLPAQLAAGLGCGMPALARSTRPHPRPRGPRSARRRPPSPGGPLPGLQNKR